ncbi:MAG: TlpA family protein disulfide reductase [bacterium]|nr:TlpA family protein disulfide reductase [bacterium]
MNPRLRVLLIATALVVAALIVIPFFRSDGTRPAGPAGLAGSQAPVYTMQTDAGASASLAAYRGKIVVMNLWASWCPPCRAEMPDLERLYEQYRGRGVVVVGVNQGEAPARAAAFASSLGITFPIWVDDQQRYGRVYAALGLPTTVLVGRDGVVVRGFDGALTLAQMRAAIAPLVRAR